MQRAQASPSLRLRPRGSYSLLPVPLATCQNLPGQATLTEDWAIPGSSIWGLTPLNPRLLKSHPLAIPPWKPPPLSSSVTLHLSSVPLRAQIYARNKRHSSLQPDSDMVCDVRDTYFHKGKRGGFRWPLITLHLSPDPSFCGFCQPVGLRGLSHILEWVGERVSRKNSLVPKHNWKGQAETGTDRKQRRSGATQGQREDRLTHRLL